MCLNKRECGAPFAHSISTPPPAAPHAGLEHQCTTSGRPVGATLCLALTAAVPHDTLSVAQGMEAASSVDEQQVRLPCAVCVCVCVVACALWRAAWCCCRCGAGPPFHSRLHTWPPVPDLTASSVLAH